MFHILMLEMKIFMNSRNEKKSFHQYDADSQSSLSAKDYGEFIVYRTCVPVYTTCRACVGDDDGLDVGDSVNLIIVGGSNSTS